MYQQYIKRTLDTVLAVVALIILLPLCLVIALLIKLTSKGPALFTQERTGYLGNNFRVYKFRTMTHNNDVHDAATPNKLTKFGKSIRTFSLDELPQLLNVVKGEMALIGPRPWIPEYHKRMNNSQRQRVSVRPGITGLAQVRGRNDLSVHEKLEQDLIYVDNLSFREDLKVTVLTIRAMFRKTGIEIEKLAIHKELDDLHNQEDTELTDEKSPVYSNR